MTLLEIVEEEEKEDLQPVQVVQWLAEMVQKAVEEGRLACGLEGCVKLLGSGPDEVMLCVLPGSSAKANVDVMIQHTLIKAFCVEHYIHVLSVDCATKLTKLIYHSYQQAAQMGKADVTMPPVPENSPGFTCVLVKYPKNGHSKEEAILGKLFKPMTKFSQPNTPQMFQPSSLLFKPKLKMTPPVAEATPPKVEVSLPIAEATSEKVEMTPEKVEMAPPKVEALSKVEVFDPTEENFDFTYQEYEPETKLSQAKTPLYQPKHESYQPDVPLFKPKPNVYLQPYVELPD